MEKMMLIFSTWAIHSLGLIGVGLFKVIQIPKHGRKEIRKNCAGWLHWAVREGNCWGNLWLCVHFSWENDTTASPRLSKGWDIHLGQTKTWNTFVGIRSCCSWPLATSNKVQVHTPTFHGIVFQLTPLPASVVPGHQNSTSSFWGQSLPYFQRLNYVFL